MGYRQIHKYHALPFKQDENSEGVILGISHLPYTIKPDYLEGLNQLNGIPSHSSLKYPHCISINNTYINSTPSNESKKYTVLLI